jgi:hypothetical protein
LLLMGFLKHKTLGMIVQDFHNVSPVNRRYAAVG